MNYSKKCQPTWEKELYPGVVGPDICTVPERGDSHPLKQKKYKCACKIIKKSEFSFRVRKQHKNYRRLEDRYRSFSSKLKQYPRDAHKEMLFEYNLTVPPYLEPSQAPSHKQ